MRDFATKADGSTTLTAAEFNSYIVELENLALNGNETLDAAAGPDTFLEMLSRAVTRHALSAMSYQDTGSANSYVLGAVQGFEQPTAYFDGMTVSFIIANTNTGASTVNVSSIGAVSLTNPGGSDFASGELVASNIIVARYLAASNRFEVVVNTTPPAVGAAAPDQYAVYDDTGTAAGFTLGIESGYTQPSSFTDAMVVLFKASAANDGAGTHPATFAGLGSKDVVEKDGTNPIANRIKAGDWVLMVFREVRDAFEIAFVYNNPARDLFVPCGTSSSSGTLYNLSSKAETNAPTAYTDGMVIIFRAPETNTGSLDVNVDGIGAVDLRDLSGSNFASGEVRSNDLVIGFYTAGGSEDRFRAFVAKEFQDLREPRAARVENPVQNSIGTTFPGPDETIQFGVANVDFDELGFFDDGSDSFVIPAGLGIKRVDVWCNFNANMTTTGATDGGYDLTIQKNGVGIAQASVPFKNQGLASSALFLGEEPVNDGDTFRVQLRVSGTGTSVTITDSTKFGIRVTKFSE